MEERSGIINPHDHDVLSGRGNGVNMHKGNLQYRQYIASLKAAYVAAPKREKGTFPYIIVRNIQNLNPPGRFLKRDSSTGTWCEITVKDALAKTRQALREGAPTIIDEQKRQLGGGVEGSSASSAENNDTMGDEKQMVRILLSFINYVLYRMASNTVLLLRRSTRSTLRRRSRKRKKVIKDISISINKCGW